MNAFLLLFVQSIWYKRDGTKIFWLDFFSKAIIHLVSLSQDFFPSWATLTDMDPVNIIKIQIFTLETNV